ncbi:hypothetical protein BLNAU_21622 [Blattamonas nauphoetae]|uniref:Uncharacterized protein n=1 Tax=Blattamonas nauphoetae TaxID=2049346 RepID=A0ABQ9WVB3_9EUKA|nr:hypothetical protein BLNAU_21622 [Blattamonas nauphoetae]
MLFFEDKSSIYNSLVALVRDKFPFNNILQDRAVRFLKSLEPNWGDKSDYADKLVTDLVSSSPGSPSGFVASMETLLSSSSSTVVAAAISFLYETLFYSSNEIRCRLVESDLISNVLATVQPHTLPISGNESIFDKLTESLFCCVNLAFPSYLTKLGITSAVDAFNYREMIFQKAVLPSSGVLMFLISNRRIVFERFPLTFVNLLSILLRIGPFHRPTLEFVLASPIAMAFSSSLSFVENSLCLVSALKFIDNSLKLWKAEGPEVAQSGKRMMQALISEGFEDTIKQMIKQNTIGVFNCRLVEECQSIWHMLGSNVEIPEW